MTAASRHEHLALFDPAAIPADTPVDPDLQAQDPKLLPQRAITELAARGQALIVHIPTEDCEARFRLFVNEEPSEEIRRKATIVLAGAVLRVPGGLLKADGLEFLTRPGEVRVHSLAEQISVPAGQYSVEVLDLLSWKIRHRLADGRRGLGRLDQAVHRLVVFYTWLGILLVPGNVLVAPLVVAFFARSRGWRSGLVAASIIVAVDVLLLGGFWLLQAARTRLPVFFRVSDADAAFDRENPDIIIVMRPDPDGARAVAPSLARLRLGNE